MQELEELERRAALVESVRTVLGEALTYGAGRVRKGVVQELVAEALQLRRSNQLARVVIDVLAEHGVEAVAVDGYFFFKGISLKR